MPEQNRDETPQTLVISDVQYLENPTLAFEPMRSGVDVLVQPTNGCARMLLSAELLSAVTSDNES